MNKMDHWHGNFVSNMYSSTFVNGSIRTILPNIKRMLSRDYTVDATITYKGVYRWNQSVDLSLNGSPDQTGHSSQPSYTFKGASGRQTIDFKCTSITDDKITGIYSTTNPSDTGTFELYKGSADNVSGACRLM